MSSGDIKYTWRLAGPSVVLLLVVMLILYQRTVLYLIDLWNQLDVGEYAHGYLVLAISGYLVLRNRQRLSRLMPSPEYRAIPAVLAATMLWMVSALVDVEMIQSVALLLLVLTILWTLLGNQVMRVLAFPVLFIAFAIPVWFPLSPVLQNLVADSVFWTIRLLSVPALRQDNMIVLPAGTLSIAEACSGLRYLLAALTLGTLYAYMNYTGLRARLIVVLISAGSAVLANMLRVFIVVYLGYKTDMQHPLVDDHLSLGWYIFAGLVVILLFIDARLHRGEPLKESSEPQHETTSALYKVSPLYLGVFVIGGSLLLSIAPAVVYKVNNQAVEQVVAGAIELPERASGWSSYIADDDWTPVFHGALNIKQSYRKGSNNAVLYVGYYPVQTQGNELINDLNSISDDELWHPLYPYPRLQNIGETQVLEQLIENNANRQRLVWYWYNVAGRVTTNKYEAKVLQILGLLKARPEAYVVAVATQAGDDAGSARLVLKDIILSIDEPLKNELLKLSER